MRLFTPGVRKMTNKFPEVSKTPKEDVRTLLFKFNVEQLIDLMEIKAKKYHDFHYSIFSFNTEYKVAFGIVDVYSNLGHKQLASIKGSPTLKEALINAIICEKTFLNYWNHNSII